MAVTVAVTSVFTVALLVGAGSGPTTAPALAAPVSLESLSGFSHPLTTTTAPPARHIASIAPRRPTMAYKMPKEFKAGHRPPHYLATTMAPITTTTTVPPTTDPPTTAAPAYDPATSGMGAPGSFQACVAWRESTDGEGSSDIYGILPYIWNDVIGFAGSPYDASLATQDAAFWKLYDMDGTSPWAPYDGC